jgi:L-alanine-DL-glutamate epimerase-like enolase superfamily enzyme
MDRRTFVKSLAAGTLSSFGLSASSEAFAAPVARTPELLRRAEASLPAARITGIRLYQGPNVMPLQIPLLQSSMVVAIDTDIGITGIGEGGTLDTITPCAGRFIGKNPFEITRLWQDLYRAFHYPPGRERLHAMGALDLALWDLKGKALNVPVYELLGGMTRNYLECYTTTFRGGGTTLKERAAACMAAGWRYFRFDAASLGGGNSTYDARERVLKVAADCREAREGVGPGGNFAVDFHQRFNFTDALRCCRMIEEYAPFLVEDPVATDLFDQDLPKLRSLTSVPLAAGEEWGARYDFNRLVQNRDIDYIRVSLPNTGGITEMIRICSLCETHEVGIVPHFTGPIATAAQVHTLGAFPIPVVFEYNYESRPIPYLEEFVTFREGKVYANNRPGLGVTVNFDQLQLVKTFTEPINRPTYYRPDGSQITW